MSLRRRTSCDQSRAEEVTDCNCTLCRSYGVLWAYYSPKDVTVTGGATDIYMRGERKTEFHRCKHCGCVTHWTAVDKTRDRMGVNARLMAPEVWPARVCAISTASIPGNFSTDQQASNASLLVILTKRRILDSF